MITDIYTYVKMCCMAKGITFAELASQLEIKPQSLTQNLKKGYFSETGLTRIANFINADYVFEAPKKLSSQEKVVDFMSKERNFYFIDRETGKPIIADPLVKGLGNRYSTKSKN